MVAVNTRAHTARSFSPCGGGKSENSPAGGFCCKKNGLEI